MGRELGRISGPLLSANLERDGVDLRFEDDLLYLSVVDTANPSKKVGIGINKLNPTRELFIDNNTHTTNLVVDTWATVGLTGSQFNIINNKIQYDGSIVLQPNQSSDPTITTTRVGTKDYNLSVNYLNISDKLIENLSNNSNIQLNPSITGKTQFDTSEVYVNGSLESTGNITFDGDITFGSDDGDSVDFKSDVNSHIIPNITNTYDLGTALKRWANVYVHNLKSNNSTVTSQTFGTLTANGTSGFDGNAYLGNASTDHITFTSLLDNNLIPTNGTYTLGNSTGPNRWNTVFLKELDVDGVIYVVNNTITTLTTDTNLELVASGTGKIVVANTDVEITNDLTVDQLTTLTNVDITGLLNLTGDYTWNQTGTTQRTGNTDITGSLTVNGPNTVQFEDIKFVNNLITTTLPSSNLVLTANGTGLVKTTVTNVEITNDLDVGLTGDFDTVNATTVYANAYDIGSVYITDNIITTNVLNTNLVLSADGAGEIHVTTTDVEITNDLEVNQLTTLVDVDITGLLDLIGDNTWNQTGTAHRTGDTDITGSLTVNGANTVQFDDIQFVGNVFRTTLGTDLKLQANGTGIVKILTSDVEITNDLNVTLHGGINTVNATTVTANAYNITDVYITGNSITTDFLNRNLELSADGAGRIYVTTTDVEITNNLNVDTATSLANVDITGLLDLTGDYTWQQTGTTYRTGDTDITGSLTVNGANTVQFEDIKFVSNRITTTVTDSDLTLTSDVTKEIHVTTTDVEITNDLDVDDTGYFNTVDAGTVVADSFDIGSVYVTGNSITTNTTNTNLVLEADGTGTIYIPLTDVSISNDLSVAGPLTINGDTSLKNTIIRSETLTPTTTQAAQNVSGTSSPTGFFFYGWQGSPSFSLIQPGWTVVGQPTWVVTTVGDGVTNYDITITGGSFASGGTYSFTGDVITYGPKTLTQTGNIDQTGNTYVTGTFTNNGPITIVGSTSYLASEKIKIQNHKISVTAVDTDLKFVGTGSGGIVLDSKLKFKDSTISNVWASPTTDAQKSIIFDPDGTGNVVFDAVTSLTIPYGNSSNQVLNAVGQIRQNSTTGHYEGWSPNGLVSFTGIYDSDSNTYITPELTFGANDNVIRFGINGIVKQTIDVTKLSNNTIHIDDISVSGNTISNLISSNNLEINVSGTGVVNINSTLVKDNTITNTSNSALILENTGTGYVKFGGTGAVVFPAGSDADRRGTPELGEIRYNTDHNYTEVWDGNSWVSVSGSAAAATEEEVTAETNLWAFVLG